MIRKSIIILASAALAGGIAVSCGGKEDDGHSRKRVNTGGGGGGTATTNTGGGGDTGQKPAATGNYTGGAVDNGGVIAGVVKYTGDKRSPELKVTKDPDTCKHGGKPDGSIAVKDGNLKNVVVYIDGITKGKQWADGEPTVDNVECLFAPRVSIVKKRAKVIAKNSDPLSHNVNMFYKDGNKTIVNAALPTQGMTKETLIKKTGLIGVKCDIHEWMKGWVWSTEHPYAVITDENGAFELTDVPAGEYTVKMWHEVFGDASAKVKVDAGGKAEISHEYQ